MDLDAIISTAAELEPLTSTVTRVVQISTDPQGSVGQLAQIVSLDSALTVRVLRAANSAASAPRAPIVTAEAAVLRLGAGAVLSLALSAPARATFLDAPPSGGLPEAAVWRLSVASASIVQGAARAKSGWVPGEAIAGALLHLIGLPVLERHLTPLERTFVRRAEHEGALDRCSAESEILGVNHAEIGELLARRWGLPEMICHAIGHYDGPFRDIDPVCRWIHAAHEAAVAAACPPESDDARTSLSTAAFRLGQSMGPAASRAEQVIVDVRRELPALLATYD